MDPVNLGPYASDNLYWRSSAPLDKYQYSPFLKQLILKVSLFNNCATNHFLGLMDRMKKKLMIFKSRLRRAYSRVTAMTPGTGCYGVSLGLTLFKGGSARHESRMTQQTCRQQTMQLVTNEKKCEWLLFLDYLCSDTEKLYPNQLRVFWHCTLAPTPWNLKTS